MKLSFLKHHLQLWSYTTAALLLLLAAGAITALWIGSNDQTQTVDTGILIWWRLLVYSLLLYFWPGIASHFTKKKANPPKAKRNRLLTLIILYEVLIVQNPLAKIVGWVG